MSPSLGDKSSSRYVVCVTLYAGGCRVHAGPGDHRLFSPGSTSIVTCNRLITGRTISKRRTGNCGGFSVSVGCQGASMAPSCVIIMTTTDHCKSCFAKNGNDALCVSRFGLRCSCGTTSFAGRWQVGGV